MKRRTLLGSIAAALCFWKTDAQAAPPRPTESPIDNPWIRRNVWGQAVMYSDQDRKRWMVVVPDVKGEGVWYHEHGNISPVLVDEIPVDFVCQASCHRVMWLPVYGKIKPRVVEISSTLHRETYVSDRGKNTPAEYRFLTVSPMDRYLDSLEAAKQKHGVT